MSNDQGWGAFLKRAMTARRVANAAELSRLTGVDQTQISRWLRDVGQPSIDNLRRLAPVLRVGLLELMVEAGHVTQAEARLRDVPRGPSPSVPTDILTAIESDIELLDEAREHLRNQYQLLRRLGPELSDRRRTTTSPRRAAPLRPDRRLRPVAHEGDPAHADVVDEIGREVRRQYEEGEGDTDR